MKCVYETADMMSCYISCHGGETTMTFPCGCVERTDDDSVNEHGELEVDWIPCADAKEKYFYVQ